jgi:hypothetical protein
MGRVEDLLSRLLLLSLSQTQLSGHSHILVE